MKRYLIVESTNGHKVAVNVDLVRVVRQVGQTGVQLEFDATHGVLVDGTVEDVTEALREAYEEEP